MAQIQEMQTGTPPREITLVYRPAGKKSHVFTAAGAKMEGFHISSPDRKVAFDLAALALGAHVGLVYGVDPLRYEIETSYDDFEAHVGGINGNRVRAVIAAAHNQTV
jgi:hypothetical protein